MQGFLYDLRSGFRILTKSPGPAAVAVFVLTIGIGLTATMFSIVNGTVMRGLPFEDGHRLMHLETQNLAQGMESLEAPLHDFLDWRAEQTSFESLSGFTFDSMYVSGDGLADRFPGSYITADAFDQLRVQPVLGRSFTARDDEPGTPRVALIGYNVWRDRYAQSPDVIGRTLQINGEPATIVGVMPKGFKFPFSQSLWLPLQPDANASQRGAGPTLEVFGRLKDGVSIDEARLEMATLAKRLEMAYPASNANITARIQPYTAEFMGQSGGRNTIAYTCLGAVVFVLLITCFNVTNLLLARTTVRSRELALRTTLGASRGRMMSQILFESFCLAAVASLIGVLLARWGVEIFNRSVDSQNWPFWFDVRLDGETLLAVLAMVVTATLIAGWIPALRASKIDLNTILKGDAAGTVGRSGRLHHRLVIAEVALSCTLLIGAGLLIRSVIEMGRVDLAYSTENLLTGRIALPLETHPDVSTAAFYEQVERTLNHIPGVISASLTSSVPLSGSSRIRYGTEGQNFEDENSYPVTRLASISPTFFETLGVEVTLGRTFSTSDHVDSQPVVVINRHFAERVWPGENPIGRQIRTIRDGEEDWLTVIGVVPDLNQGGLSDRLPQTIYVPMAQQPMRFMSAMLKTSGDPRALALSVRQSVASIDSTVPFYQVSTFEEQLDQSTFFNRLIASLFSIMALAAWILAITGLYGVLAFSVSRRQSEVGVRMALGAARRDIRRLIVGQGLHQILKGLTFGLLLAAAVAHLLGSLLFGIEAWDLLTFALVTALLLVFGLLASWVPAMRATRVQPVEALRRD